MKYELCNKSGSRAWGGRRLMRIAGASMLVLVVAGCEGRTRYQKIGPNIVADPSERNPILVSKKTQRISFKVRRGDYGLSNLKKSKLHAFARRYVEEGSSKLYIAAPSGTANEAAAFNVLNDVRRVLKSEGINGGDVVFRPYARAGSRNAPIMVSYKKYHATPPHCGEWPTNLGRTPQNVPYANLGCATQNNLAVAIANPKDLIEPRDMTPRSSERRHATWRKYVKGEDTTSKDSRKQRAKISDLRGN